MMPRASHASHSEAATGERLHRVGFSLFAERGHFANHARTFEIPIHRAQLVSCGWLLSRDWANPILDRQSVAGAAIHARADQSRSTYTAIVRGANNSTGIAVVEVFALNQGRRL
jgi:hypothetical protein